MEATTQPVTVNVIRLKTSIVGQSAAEPPW
nr:MAG TPA: hypothetical protein [Caudoviricetes sp.]